MGERHSTHLPEIKSNGADLVVLVDGGVSNVLGVVDLWMHPGSFVVGVVQHPWLPLALEGGVVDLRGLPFTVHLIVPVLWLHCVRVGDVLRLVPVLQ